MSAHAAIRKRQHEENAPQNAGPGKLSQVAGVGLPLFMQANPTASAGVTLQRKCACVGTAGANDECPTCNSGKPLQTKLTIGASDDPLEQEADRVADEVLTMPTPVQPAAPRIQRFAAHPGGHIGSAPASVGHALASSGHALDPPLQQDMAQRFGHDFSTVQVHTGELAAQSAREISANAYTTGRHIVFGAGQFAPASETGRRLLAHELTHVVQQSSGGAPAVQRDDQKPVARIDVALVLDDSADAMTEARTYATTVIRATSGADAKAKLEALGKPIGTIFVVSHSNSSGEVQVISGIGTISHVKLSELSKDMKGMSGDKLPQAIDFRGCKLGEAPQEMETFRQNIGARTARATNCWSMVKTSEALPMPDGTPITQESQIAGHEKEFDAALRLQINRLKSADRRPVKNCITGLAAGETANNNFKKIRNLYFQNQGNLSAGWASPEFNDNWQQGSICAKDMTATTAPCKIVTQSAPAADSATKK